MNISEFILLACLIKVCTADLGQFDDNVDRLCETKKCTELASNIWSNMDRDVNPCDDFYKYACGRTLPNDTLFKAEGNIYDVQENLHKKLMYILRTSNTKSNINIFDITKLFYRTCLQRGINAYGEVQYSTDSGLIYAAAFINLLKKFGGWPAIDKDWNENSFDWMQIAAKINDMGFNHQGFISISIKPDIKNKSTFTINLGESVIFLKYPGFSANNENRDGFRNLILDVAKIMASDAAYYDTMIYREKPNKKFTDDMTDALDFLEELSKASERKQPPEEQVSNLMTIKELSSIYPTIPWLKYIDKMVKSAYPIDENNLANVQAPKYFSHLEKVLIVTPKRTVMNAMIIGMMYASLPFITNPNIDEKYMQYLNIPRWKKCVVLTSATFPVAVGSLYARQYFGKADRKFISDIFKDVKQEMNNRLKKTGWMSDKTKLTAINKLEITSTHLPNVNNFLEDNKINEYYQDTEIKMNCTKICNRYENSQCDRSCFRHYNTNIFDMMLKANRFNLRKYYSSLGMTVDKYNWDSNDVLKDVTDLTFDLKRNNIEIPTALLQFPYVDKNVPNYVNYASLGTLYGTLLTHSWDDLGRSYNATGQNSDWWDEHTKIAYQRRAACYIKQHNEINSSGNKGEGFQMENANIADHAGLTAAYYAYLQRIKRDGIDISLPALPLTPQQLFWISAANMYCHEYNWPHDKSSVLNNYSSDKIRTLGSFTNMPEFGKDFNCPRHTKMNPNTRCQLL